jgi:acyl carrier protein
VTILEKITELIAADKASPFPIGEDTDLYGDMGMDSLAFVKLLLDIEQVYLITFDLLEMQECLHVGRLIEIIEKKRKEKDYDQEPIDEN